MALTGKGIEAIQKHIAEKGARAVAIKFVDIALNKKVGISASDMPDTSTYANGLDEIEGMLESQDYEAAFKYAFEVAGEMLSDEGFDDMEMDEQNINNSSNQVSNHQEGENKYGRWVNGELVVTGIKNLTTLIRHFETSNELNFIVDVFDNGNFSNIVSVNENGIKTEKGFTPWEKVYFPKNGLLITYGKNEDDYLRFKRTEEEQIKHPYNQHLEKMADLKQNFQDYEDSLGENNTNNNELFELRKKVRKIVALNLSESYKKRLQELSEIDAPQPVQSIQPQQEQTVREIHSEIELILTINMDNSTPNAIFWINNICKNTQKISIIKKEKFSITIGGELNDIQEVIENIKNSGVDEDPNWKG